MAALSTLLRSQGKLTEAEQFIRRALEGQERTLGAEHSRTLISATRPTTSGLGTLLFEMRELDEAEAIFRQCLDGCEQTMGLSE